MLCSSLVSYSASPPSFPCLQQIPPPPTRSRSTRPLHFFPTRSEMFSSKDQSNTTETEGAFHLQNLNAPKLSGPALRLQTTILENSLLGSPLRNRIFTASGFTAFRQRARAAAQRDQNIQPCVHPVHYPLPTVQEPPSLSDIDSIFHQLNSDQQQAHQRRPTISSYYSAYRSGAVTPLQVAHAILKLIRISNESNESPSLNAVQIVDQKDVLEQAKRCTERWQQNTILSVLDGVPFTVKLNIDALPYQTSGASGFSEDYHVTQDADVVRALRDTGMILVGKCGMDELGLGVRGFSMFAGQVRNPHGRQFVPGGSSGGSAASVAIGLCPVSVGSDAGGSIRIPAACCGVYGLKATFGRISTWGRVLTKREREGEDAAEIVVGPITVCARDLCLMYYVMAGRAVHGMIAEEQEFEGRVDIYREMKATVNGLRVGVYGPLVESGSESGLAVMKGVLNRMVEHGAVEVQVVIPDLEDIRVSLSVLLMTTFLRTLKKHGMYGARPNTHLGLDVRGKLRMGEMFTDEDVRRARTVRAKAMEYCVKKLFGEGEIDLLVTPVTGVETPKVPYNLNTGLTDVSTDGGLMKFTKYANCTGIPACVVPAGRDKNGMPVGVQFMSAPWNERVLVDTCLWAERELDTNESMAPPEVFDPLRFASEESAGEQ